MTLIEIMVVVVVMALVVGGLVVGLGAVTGSRLRSAAMRVAAAMQAGYHRAVTKGTTVRVQFDLDKDEMSVQEASGRVALARQTVSVASGADETIEAGKAVDPWRLARARLEDTIKPSFGGSPFEAIKGSTGAPLSRFQSQDLGAGISIQRLILPHEPSPREAGTGAVYFFPGGRTQRAVVQLTDASDRVFSVEVHPLTGRARVYPYAMEPKEVTDSQARDPG